LYSSPNIIRIIKSRRIGRAVQVARMGRRWMRTGFLVGKPERKRPLGRLIHRWEDDIKVDVREMWWGGMDWIDLA
jgi:hypothetical protein